VADRASDQCTLQDFGQLVKTETDAQPDEKRDRKSDDHHPRPVTGMQRLRGEDREHNRGMGRWSAPRYEAD